MVRWLNGPTQQGSKAINSWPRCAQIAALDSFSGHLLQMAPCSPALTTAILRLAQASGTHAEG